MRFYINIKKHQHYFYVSIFLICLFFVINALITTKITDVTETLIEEVIREKYTANQNMMSFEINALDLYMTDAENTLERSTELNEDKLLSQLELISELTWTNERIVNSWVIVFNKQEVIEAIYPKATEGDIDESIRVAAQELVLLSTDTSTTQLIKREKSILERKMLVGQLQDGHVVVFGYDVDLIKFWEYYSQNYSSRGGYNVLFNEQGICLLHPEKKYIGMPMDFYFEDITMQDILKLEEESKANPLLIQTQLKTQVVSEYLGLDVMRYYSVVSTHRNHKVIQVASFPIQINMQESMTDTKRYFYWIGFLTLFTFMLILGLTRFQLKREFVKNRVFEKEKEHLKLANEKYQRENAVLQLKRLKRKMNPHFLFNSLNSLIVLIESDPELSQEFVLKLSEVYRYLLKERDGNLISVKEEMDFLNQYVFLQKIRFKTSLNVSIRYSDDGLSSSKSIPLLALETLVENGIKHNEITKTNPLFIDIVVEEQQIIVSNNYNPLKEKTLDSHHLGFEYLRNSYEYYQVTSFRTEISDDKYVCYLPLLSV